MYTIPNQVLPGFKHIATLNLEKADVIIEIISQSIHQGSISSAIKNSSHSLDIKEEDISLVIRSLLSIVDIFYDSNKSVEDFSKEFVDSLGQQHSNGFSIEDLENVKLNISYILSRAGSKLSLFRKLREILTENSNNYSESRIVSDIRIVFDDKEELTKNEQLALVVHHLRIKCFSKADPKSEIFVSMDLSDLQKLKEVVERAIQKDSLIRLNNHKLTFVNPK